MRHDQGKAVDPLEAAAVHERHKAVPKLTRTHRVLIGVVAFGAVVIASIGFAGSYSAVRRLAMQKGFGNFSYLLPVGIDAGIVVLLALDLLLTWIRIPFPLLRQTAWLLTIATIAFNGAAAWPDPLGVGMHAVIPVLFVVAVEAARHAVGRIADITADKHMESVRITRWLLSPVPTFLLWRRMKLWELRSYEQVIKLEQERLVYQARLYQRFGRAWRRKAPVEALMPLRLARYGVPLRETAEAGLASAGIILPTTELERLGGDSVREELPTTASARELEPVQVDVDRTEHHGQDEDIAAADGAANHPEPETELQPVPDPYEAYRPDSYGPDPEASYHGVGYSSYEAEHPASAPVPVAARDEGRPHVVQVRVDGPEWDIDPLGDEASSLDEDEVEPTPETEPEGLTGVDLLEWRYVQLSSEQRALSAVKLGELLHEGTGFTAGTARKYLGDIIRKHR